MITFWARLNEEEITAYAGTLILPSFMAHLERSPFRFEEQAANVDGLQALKVSYTGEGRYEEYFIHPEKHVRPMLQSVCPGFDSERIRFRPAETAWRWSSDFGQDDAAEDETAVFMRIYFEPTAPVLPPEITGRFDPRSCYVSVTRKEIFLATDVVQKYFGDWLNLLEGNGTGRDAGNLPRVEPIAGGFVFQGRRLGGEFVLRDDETFHDLLRYCGLARSLEELAAIVRPNLDDPETDISDEGLRFRLAIVKQPET